MDCDSGASWRIRSIWVMRRKRSPLMHTAYMVTGCSSTIQIFICEPSPNTCQLFLSPLPGKGGHFLGLTPNCFSVADPTSHRANARENKDFSHTERVLLGWEKIPIDDLVWKSPDRTNLKCMPIKPKKEIYYQQKLEQISKTKWQNKIPSQKIYEASLYDESYVRLDQSVKSHIC